MLGYGYLGLSHNDFMKITMKTLFRMVNAKNNCELWKINKYPKLKLKNKEEVLEMIKEVMNPCQEKV